MTVESTAGEILVNGGGNITVSGNNSSGLFRLGGGQTVLEGFSLLDGSVSSASGAITNLAGTLTVNSCTISDNIGTGILNTGFGTLTVNNCLITNNSSTSSGGAIYNDGTLLVPIRH